MRRPADHHLIMSVIEREKMSKYYTGIMQEEGEPLKAEIYVSVGMLQELLDKHRAKDMLSCEETCFCWDIEALISEVEQDAS